MAFADKYEGSVMKNLFLSALILFAPVSHAAFVDTYVGNYEASPWPEGFKIYVGRESKALFTNTGDATAYTFTAHVRQDSSSTNALISGVVTTSASDSGSITITFDDDDTVNLNGLGRRLFVTLDVDIGGTTYPVAAGYVAAEPIGSQLPVSVTPIEFDDMKAQLEALVEEAETAATAAEAAQAAAEAAAESATGIGDGDKGDITVSSSGSVWTINPDALDYDDVANTPTIPAATSDLTNDSGYITGYTVTSLDVTTHQGDIAITKSQVTDLDDADYATAAQGVLADSAVQPADLSYTTTLAGTAISIDASGFDGNLTTDDNTAQKVAQKLDDLSAGGTDWSVTQESPTADGASNVAFSLNSENTFNTGDLFNISNNGTDVFTVNYDGTLTYTGAATIIQTNTGGTSTIGNIGSGQLHLSFNTNSLGKSNEINFSDEGMFINRRTSGTLDADWYIRGNTNDNVTNDWTFRGQDAHTGATTNIVGGDISLTGGAGASGSAGLANGGNIVLAGGAGYGTGSDGLILMTNLPTSDPSVSGALWNDSGTLKISP